MKRIFALLIILAICLGLASCMPNLKKFAVKFADEKATVTGEELGSEEYLAFAKKVESFSARISTDIYKKYGVHQNFAISPLSIYMSLAIACESANGETRQEILDALGVSYEELSRYTKYLYSVCNQEYKHKSSEDKEIISARENLFNSIWVNSDLALKDSGVNSLASNYNCDVFSISFGRNVAENMINQYVEYKSEGAISGEIDVSSASAFEIVSIFALHEIWNDIGKELVQTFETHSFINSDGSSTETRLLRGHYSNGQVQVKDTYSTFFIDTEHGYKLHFIVPNEDYQLRDVLNAKNISDIVSLEDYGHIDDEKNEIHYTRVLFPSISTSFSANISQLLTEKYGIEALFDADGCDFSNLLSQDAYCKDFIHHNSLKVSAGGIQSGAVKISTSTEELPDLPEYTGVYSEFAIEQAFGFILTDAQGTILYSGVINEID